MARGKKYSAQERQLILTWYEEGRKPSEIAKMLDVWGYTPRTPHQISGFIYDNRGKQPRPANEESSVCDAIFSKLDDLRDRMLDVSRDHAVTSETVAKRANIKVLVLTDLHVPFEQRDVIEHALTNHGDAKILVIGGDFFDAYSVSKFRKSKAILFRWEYEIVVEWVRIFSGMFEQVILVSGNHERRVQRYVSDNLGNMLHGLVHDDPLKAVADGLDYGSDGKLTKLHNFENVIYEGYPRGDYARVGQLVVAHPDSYSSVPMRTTINYAQALLGLESYQCLILGHTHAMGELVWRNKLLMESGCCCLPLEYTFATGKIASLPQTYGYAVSHLDQDGNVDFANTYTVYRGIGKVIKPAVFDLGEL